MPLLYGGAMPWVEWVTPQYGTGVAEINALLGGKWIFPVSRQFCSSQPSKAEKINGFVVLHHSRLQCQPAPRCPNWGMTPVVESTRGKPAFQFGLWSKGKAEVWPVDQSGGQLQRKFISACFHMEMYSETERSHRRIPCATYICAHVHIKLRD